MNKKTILIAAVMFFAMSVAAYAQATFLIGSTPVTAVTSSGNTEKTGDITFSPLAGSDVSLQGTFTINYGVAITSPWNAISVTGNGFTKNFGASNLFAGILVLDVAPLNPVGMGVVSGVRVQIAGTPLNTLSVDISATGNAIFNAGQPVKVISAVSDGLAGIGYKPPPNPSAAADINSVAPNTNVGYDVIANITEGYLNAFGVIPGAPPGDPTATNSTMLKITLSALPTTGVSITFPHLLDTTGLGVVQTAGAFETTESDGTPIGADVVITSQSDSLDVYYAVATNTKITVKETVVLPIHVGVYVGFGGATLPLPAQSVTMQVTLAPLKPAFNPNFTLPVEIPRYDVAPVGPLTIYNISPGTTTLMIPFATTDAGFDTGIGIVNSTTDPGVAKMGFAGAVNQSGTMTFYFYPQSGAAIAPYTTSSLASGGTYAALLSEILSAAGADPLYTGYIIVVCNFTNAHGQYFVTDFGSFANGAQALVIPGARTNTPESVGQ